MTKKTQNCKVKVDQNNQQMHCTLQGDQDTLDNFRKQHNSGGDGDNVLQTDLDLSNFQFQPTNCTGPIKLTCTKFLVDNRQAASFFPIYFILFIMFS